MRPYHVAIVGSGPSGYFAAASLLCGVAPSIAVLIATRILQGVGGALLTPGSMAILQASFREADRGDFTPAHEEADMDTLWVPYAELLAACLDGRVHDAPVLIAVLTARQRGLVGNGGAGG